LANAHGRLTSTHTAALRLKFCVPAASHHQNKRTSQRRTAVTNALGRLDPGSQQPAILVADEEGRGAPNEKARKPAATHQTRNPKRNPNSRGSGCQSRYWHAESDKDRKAEEQPWLRAHGRLPKRAAAIWGDFMGRSQGARAGMRREAVAVHDSLPRVNPVASNHEAVTDKEYRGSTKPESPMRSSLDSGGSGRRSRYHHAESDKVSKRG